MFYRSMESSIWAHARPRADPATAGFHTGEAVTPSPDTLEVSPIVQPEVEDGCQGKPRVFCAAFPARLLT
jgi:hypothetical protein